MIIRMEAGEPPDRRDVAQRKRKLIAPLKNIQRGIVVPFVIEMQADEAFERQAERLLSRLPKTKHKKGFWS